MKIAIYARVSDKDQHCEMQLTDLRGLAQRNDWEAIEYVEKASGKTGGKRPVLARLMNDARLRRFDAVVVWKLDRFARSVLDFSNNVKTLDALGIRFMSPHQGIDTGKQNPFSKAMMQLMAVFAELERDLIVERVRAGVKQYIADYKAGKVGTDRHSWSKKDLPPGRPKRIFPRDKAVAMRKAGSSIREIAKALGVGRGTVERLLKVSQKPS